MAAPAPPPGFTKRVPAPPEGYTKVSDEMATLQPTRKQEIAQELQRRGVMQPQTTAGGLAGAITRGAGPYAAGAALGAAAGSPIAGVGAVPGAIAGTAAVGAAKIIGDPVVDLVNQTFGTKYSRPTDALEDLFTRLGVESPDTAAEQILQQTAGGAAGAGGMAALGQQMAKAAGPVVSGVGRQLAAQPAQQVAGGAAGALSGEVAEELGAGPDVQLAASILGGAAGAGAAGARLAPTKELQDIQSVEEAGIRALTTDIRKPGNFFTRFLQATGEKIPVAGTGGVRQAQQAERVQAVQDVLEDFGASEAIDNIQDISRDLLANRSKQLKQYSKSKNNVINDISVKTTEPVDVTSTINRIDDEISKLNAIGTESSQQIAQKLSNWRENLQGKPLNIIENIRKEMGEFFKASDLAGIRSQGEASLSNIYGPLRQDMGDHIRRFGERRDFDKWNVANKRLSAMANELDMNAFKSVLRRGDKVPEEINKMLFSKKPSEIKQLYKALTPDGRANARAAILQRAAEKSELVDGFSPDRFANEVERLGNSVGVFFTGNDLKRIEGLSRALNLTRRAGQAAAAPPTGVQLVPFVGASVLTDLLGGYGAGLAGTASVGGIARVLESRPVRNLLVNISRVDPGTEEEVALVKRLISTIQSEQEVINE